MILFIIIVAAILFSALIIRMLPALLVIVLVSMAYANVTTHDTPKKIEPVSVKPLKHAITQPVAANKPNPVKDPLEHLKALFPDDYNSVRY